MGQRAVVGAYLDGALPSTAGSPAPSFVANDGVSNSLPGRVEIELRAGEVVPVEPPKLEKPNPISPVQGGCSAGPGAFGLLPFLVLIGVLGRRGFRCI